MISSTTKLITLGTGNPNPNPDHAGPSLLVLVDDIPYLVDSGPGLIRQAAAMTSQYGGKLEKLKIENLATAFLTHLHSDHTIGLPDLILTPWVMGREKPLELYGPKGTSKLTQNILKAYRDDIQYRLDGLEPANDQGWRVNAHEIQAGIVYQDNQVTVEAFPVQHGSWTNAFGYRFTTPDKVIVFSGDTAPCQNIVTYSQGADILIHEVYAQQGFDQKDREWQEYHASHHTSTYELAEIAKQVRPELLILNHVLFWGSSKREILAEIAAGYDGRVVLAADSQVFE
jgi:ribonuclease Z